MLKKVLQNLAIILMVLLLQAGMVLADKSIPKTGDPAWDTLSQVKKDGILKLYDIVVVDRPELKPVADDFLEWRLKEMEYDTKRFQYMSDKHPDMIIRDKGLYAFVNLDWFPEFSEELSRKDPAFAELAKKVKTLKAELDKRKNFKVLEEFINNLNKNEKYKEKVDHFLSEMNKVSKILTSSEVEVTGKKQ